MSRPRRDHWPLLVLGAALPLLVGIAVLQVLVGGALPLTEAEVKALARLTQGGTLPSGHLTFAALVVVHLFVCAAAIAWAVALTWRSAPRPIMLAAWLMALSVSAVVAVAVLSGDRADGLAFPRLTSVIYADYFAALHPSGRASFVPLAILLPSLPGVLAVSLMAAAATSIVRNLYQVRWEDEEEEELALCLANQSVRRCGYLLSLVLVTSTAAASLFFHLPAQAEPVAVIQACAENAAGISPCGTLQDQFEQLRDRFERFAGELSLFWGAIYSLTLFMAAGVQLILVQRNVHDFLDRLKPPERAATTRARLLEGGVLSGGMSHSKVLLALAAPILSAPLSEVLQVAIG